MEIIRGFSQYGVHLEITRGFSQYGAHLEITRSFSQYGAHLEITRSFSQYGAHLEITRSFSQYGAHLEITRSFSQYGAHLEITRGSSCATASQRGEQLWRRPDLNTAVYNYRPGATCDRQHVETEASYKTSGIVFDTNRIAQHSEYCTLSSRPSNQ